MHSGRGPGTARHELRGAVDAIGLIDHHMHSVFRVDVDRPAFEKAMTEARTASSAPLTAFDSQLGFAMRRHCAPVLDLQPFADPAAYLARRSALGGQETARRMIAASGIELALLDHGFAADDLFTPEELTARTGLPTRPIVRLEHVAEQAYAVATQADELMRDIEARLESTLPTAVAYKTIAAYRTGLALEPEPPGDDEVRTAAAEWIAAGDGRLCDPVLIRHLIWWALRRGVVLQVHTGFGDPDLRLLDANPLHLQPLIARAAATGAHIALLHCYPFEREAGYLCHAYPHVVMDVGLAIGHLGAHAVDTVRRALDLAPLHSVLFSTDAWGLPELVLLGARLWRDAVTDELCALVEAGAWTLDDAVRVARMIGYENARRVYGFDQKGA